MAGFFNGEYYIRFLVRWYCCRLRIGDATGLGGVGFVNGMGKGNLFGFGHLRAHIVSNGWRGDLSYSSIFVYAIGSFCGTGWTFSHHPSR